MARGEEIGEEGARLDGCRPEEGPAEGRLLGQAAGRPSAVHSGGRLPVQDVPR